MASSKITPNQRTTLTVAVIAASASLIGALSGSFITGNYLIKSTSAQVEKDIATLSSQNAQKGMEKSQEKVEQFLVALHDLIGYFETHDRFVNTEAKAKLLEVERRAFALIPYVSPAVAGKSVEVCVAVRNAIDSTTPEERTSNIKKIVPTTGEWIKLYYDEMAKYQSRSMPDKWKYDLLGTFGGLLFRP